MTIEDLSSEPSAFFKFGYELRKFDGEFENNDYYTKAFIDNYLN